MSEINCSTCRWCKEDRCEIRYQTAGPKIQECYDPDLPVVTDAIYELTSLRYKATPQISRGAAILLDLFSGVSEDMIKQKYSDTYGQAGYDNSGYARVCEAALCSLDDTEASKAFRMWYQAYCFRRDKKILKQAMSYGRSRSFKRLTLSVVEVIDDAKREWTDSDGNRNTYTTKLFLPAASEIFEEEYCLGDKRVYDQLEYYKDVKNRIRVDEDDSPRGYWLASVLSEDPRVCTVDSHGLPDYWSASQPFLFKPICFHISKSYGKNTMGMIKSFRGKYSFLSNFYTAPVAWEGITYCNSEAAFQSAKCVNQADRDAFAGLSASEAKRLGRQVKLRDDWELVKEDVMYEICLSKFSQNTKLKEKLLLTGNDLLVEGNTCGDQFWGVVNGVGQNKLGKILMQVRDVLHNEE